LRTDTNGDTIWTKTFGGVNDERTFSMILTTDNNILLAGYTESFGAGDADVYLIKTNMNGDTLWTKTFGGLGLDYGQSVQETNNGEYIITGYTESFGASIVDVLLIKTSSNGDVIWSATYGGVNVDLGYSVDQTSDNGFIILGCTNSSGNGGQDLYLLKLESSISNINTDKNYILPGKFILFQNYPNPFNPSTRIKYELSKSEKVKIEVFNMLGQKIETLTTKSMSAGLHEIEFTSKDLPSGVYMYRIQAGEFQEVKKMILLQ